MKHDYFEVDNVEGFFHMPGYDRKKAGLFCDLIAYLVNDRPHLLWFISTSK